MMPQASLAERESQNINSTRRKWTYGSALDRQNIHNLGQPAIGSRPGVGPH
jgi:hypothetical protein